MGPHRLWCGNRWSGGGGLNLQNLLQWGRTDYGAETTEVDLVLEKHF
jgi:hypothetical protein